MRLTMIKTTALKTFRFGGAWTGARVAI